MHKFKSKVGYFPLKIDLVKAYGDNISWNFVHNVLTEINIPRKLKDLIMESIQTVKMRVLQKGEKRDFFEAKKGLRQGDPLSPYLFVLCIDMLSHMIIDATKANMWDCIKIGTKGPHLTHMIFANDLILFGKATDNQVQNVTNILHSFCKFFGQKINIHKSNIIFACNTLSSTTIQILTTLGFKETEPLGIYSRVTLTGKDPHVIDYKYLIEKVQSKLFLQKSKQLPFAGIITLANVVIEALPTYMMMTVAVPKTCIKDIQKFQRAFI